MLADLVKLDEVSDCLDFSNRFVFFTYNFDGHLSIAILVLTLYYDISWTCSCDNRIIYLTNPAFIVLKILLYILIIFMNIDNHTALHLFDWSEYIKVFDIIILGSSFKVHYPLLLNILSFETKGQHSLFAELGASNK